MLKKVATVGIWLGVLTGVVAGTSVWGKPADLPGNNQIECADGENDPPAQRKFSIDLGLAPDGITLKIETADAEPEAAPAIDAVMPAFVEQWLQHVGDLLARPDRVINLDALLSKFPRVGGSENGPACAPSEPQPRAGKMEQDSDERVLPLFVIAEVYRRTGHYESARFYYQRVHLLSPTSRLGRMAIDRLQQVEERLRDDAEEADTPGRKDQPKPESMNREMHKGLMPLGLVRVRY